MEPVIRKIVCSKKRAGMLAYDREDGHILQAGTFIALQYKNDWYAGIIIQQEEGWYMDTILLLEGMFIKLL